MSTFLSVNVNKLATLRNSRGKNNPNVIMTAQDIVHFGAHGITVHPRPDERHIRRQDVYDLKKVLNVELNVEGYPSNDFLNLINDVRPAQTTLVPDPPEALTSNAGWRVGQNLKKLEKVLSALHKMGTRISVFVEPGHFTADDARMLKNMGAHRVELYTESYALGFEAGTHEQAILAYQDLAREAMAAGLDINAGHDLNQKNLNYFISNIPSVREVSIGHALICDALYDGLEKTIQNYLLALSNRPSTL